MTEDSPVGIFLVRAWQESGQLWARVIRCADLSGEMPVERLTANPDDLLEQLRDWLTDVRREPGTRRNDGS